ncbi:MAG: ABC transporter substrate-binding protein [Spirochaetaceae bacterium]|jgi:raffinose/stachyose/melibiose transport system substrate-binding protein|nr:ABC transporter substrate-binding protein [Spirochaetaceae bacterium]
MKKITGMALGLAFVLAFSVWAGGGGQRSAGGAAKSNVTLTMMVSQGWTTAGDEEIIRKFKEATGITVDLQVIPADQHHDLVKARLSSGEGPDLFMVQTNEFAIKTATLDPERYLLDMSGESWVNVMPKNRLPAVSWNGKPYGLMLWYNSPEFIYVYNKTLFNELGITKAPETFAEMDAACKKILDAGIVPIYEYVADGWHHQLPFFQVGPRYEERRPGLYKGLNDNTIKFADVADFETVLNQINSFAQKGYYGQYYMSNTGADQNEAFATRKAAIITASSAAISQIRTEYPETKDEFGLILLRFLDNNTFPTNPAGPALFACAQTKYPNEVKEFFRFMTTPQSLQTKLDGNPEWTNIDVTVPVQQHWTVEEEVFMKGITDTQKNIQAVLQTGTKYTNDQWMEFGADMASMFMGRMTAKQVLQATDERRANMARSQNDPAWK